MKEYTDNEKLALQDDLPVEEGMPVLTPPEPPEPAAPVANPGWLGRVRHSLRQANQPRYHNPRVSSLLQIVPGAGYLYQWRIGNALLTAFLFLLAYIVLGMRFLQYTPADLKARATAINPNPEPDLWNWSVLEPSSLLLVFGLLALLILNLMGRTYQETVRNNLSLQKKSIAELRAARGGLLDTLLYFNYLALIVIVFGLALLVKDTEFDLNRLVSKFDRLVGYIGGLLSPTWSELTLPKGVLFRARETLEIAILGTLGGFCLALPLSLLAARNLMGHNPITNVAYYLVRIILSVIRAIPTLFLAIIFVASVGTGAFPAMLALTIFSAGLMTKLFSEAIEAIDWGQVEAVSAAGGSPMHIVIFAVIPQVIPYFISHMLYSWEVCVHSASVLGLVGAGGIGGYIQDAINSYQYSKAGIALLVVIIITMIIDFTSAYIRKRII